MKSAWRTIAAALVLALVLGPGLLRADEAADEALELVKKVSRLYGEAVGFRANYTLQAKTARMAGQGGGLEERTSSGRIVFARPDKLRMLQEKPKEEEVVYSPEGYWWYSSELKEAHRFPIGDVAGTVKPFVSFFAGLEKARKWFEIQRMVGGDKGDNRAVKLVPQSMKMGLNRIEVLITPRGEIAEVTIHSLLGETYHYIFSDLELLDEPPDEGFFFTPPTGTKVVYH